jgi:class 3 adenylate cyclase/tetratricopeptide (TPR) repeat protein
VTCPTCGAEARPDQKFCAECGTRLTAAACSNCGAALPPGARFCPECGTPAPVEANQAVGRPAAMTAGLRGDGSHAAAAGPTAERRLVSVLFADLVDSTRLADAADAEDTREILARYYETARQVVDRYGGTIEKFIGDAVMAVWGAPTAREDDAERAVRAALDLVDAVGRLDVGIPGGIQLRAGVVTGEAAITVGAEGHGLVAGDVVNTASRLQSAAAPGAVLVGEATFRAADESIVFEPAGEQALKGKAAPVAVWRALRVVAGRGGQGRSDRPEPPFVGRDAEFVLLKDLFHATSRESRVRLISVMGPPGIGKSRLAWEFEKYIDGLVETVYWHHGRSPAYGEGITFWALGEMVRRRAEIAEGEGASSARAKLAAALATYVEDEEDRRWIEPRLTSLLGLDEAPAGEQGELFAAWRTFFEWIARKGTVAMVFEDLQWADQGLLDFIDHLLAWSKGLPILVITLARPELLERRPDWGARQRNFTSLHLEPLDRAAMRELLAGFVPGLPESAARAIIGRAEGVPLYAVETVRTLVTDGRLVLEGDAYRVHGSLDRLTIPETLHALIAARLDALDPADRSLLQDAAVLGKSFTATALAELSGQPVATLEPRLQALVGLELLRIEGDPRSPERGQYQFVQALIREVAYGTLAKRDRRVRHLSAARYFEKLGDDELAGVLASHYVDAYRATPPGPEADALAAQARVALRGAADRAMALRSTEQALAYLQQALEVTTDDVERRTLLTRIGEVGQMAGHYEESTSALQQVIEELDAAGETIEAARAATLLAYVYDSDGRMEPAIALLKPRLPAVEALAANDSGLESDVASVASELARGYMLHGDMKEAIELCDRAIQAADRLDLRRIVVESLITKGTAAMFDRYREGAALLLGAIELAKRFGLPRSQIRAMNNIGGFLDSEDLAASLENCLAAIEICRRNGLRDVVLHWQASCGFPAFLLGDWARVEAAAAVADEENVPESVRATALETRQVLLAYRGQFEGIEAIEAMTEQILAGMTHAEFASGHRITHSLTLHVAGRFQDAYDAMTAKAPPTSQHFTTNLIAGRAALRLGKLDAARMALAEVEATSERGRVTEALRVELRGGVAALEGRREDALALYRDAQRRFEELRDVVDLADAQLEMAALLGLDEPEARAAASAARQTWERLGAKAMIDQLDALEQRAGVATPRASRPSSPTAVPHEAAGS